MPDNDKYKEEFRKRYGEDIPDSVLNTLGSKGNKKVAEIKQKMKDHFKNKKGVTKKLLENADLSLGKDTIGLKKGGGPGIEALRKVRPDVVKKMGYKKGGKVKRMSCPVDGMAKRGKTRARRKGR